VAAGEWNGTITVWDVNSGEVKTRFQGHGDPVRSVDFSPDNTTLISCSGSVFSTSGDRTIKTWLIQASGSKIVIQDHNGNINSAFFNTAGTEILSTSFDGTTRLWDAATGKEIAQFIAFTDGEWIVITPDGYYNASPKGDQYLNVRIGNEVYGIDQFAEAFYHPEVVQARLQGLPNPPVVKERGSIQTASIPPAIKVSVVNENLSAGQALLSITATDWIRQIKDIEIIVNGRLVGGQELRQVSANGLAPANTRLAASTQDKQFEFTVPVNLDPGFNHIEIVAANDYNYGLKTVYVNAPETDTEQKSDLWVLAIGIDDYADNPDYLDLNYAVSDAKKIIDAFKGQKEKRFKDIHTLYISDNGELKPTKQNIISGMDFLKRAGPNDVVILFIAAHGKTEDGVYYFLPSDTVFNGNGKFDTATAVNIDDLTRALDIPGRKLVFLDTCESGGVDNNRLVRTLKNRSTVIFTASQQEEFSFENELYGGGFFTHGITRGLGGGAAEAGKVPLNKLGDYVISEVSRISRNRQHPTRLIPDGYKDFVITVTE
jgi:hypothetical protein